MLSPRCGQNQAKGLAEVLGGSGAGRRGDGQGRPWRSGKPHLGGRRLRSGPCSAERFASPLRVAVPVVSAAVRCCSVLGMCPCLGCGGPQGCREGGPEQPAPGVSMPSKALKTGCEGPGPAEFPKESRFCTAPPHPNEKNHWPLGSLELGLWKRVTRPSCRRRSSSSGHTPAEVRCVFPASPHCVRDL